jgi:DMSO/TMAO reductase YedYZ heme-binding membrane subunit
MTPEMLPWIIVRASGFVAFALIACAMIAGLLVRTRGSVGGVRAADLVDLHRHLSLIGLMAIAVHAGALLLDSTIDVAPLDLLVPGALPYRPLWTGLGVVAAELALLVHLSFAVRTRIGGRNWRRLHWLTYAVFTLGVVHGITSGTDSGTTWAIALYAGAVGAVAGLTGWRASNFRRRTSKRANPPRGNSGGVAVRTPSPSTRS